MATKSKNIKDSLLLKIISVALAMVLCLGFVKTAYVAVKYASVFGESVFSAYSPTVFDEDSFREELNEDISTMSNIANYETYSKEYEKQKAETCELALKRYKMTRGYYNTLLEQGASGEDFEDYDENEYTTALAIPNDGSKYFSSDYASEPLYVDQINTIDFNVSLIISEEKAAQIISDQYDTENPERPKMSSDNELKALKNLTYYAVGKDGTVVTNAENPEDFIANIEKRDCYYYYTEDSDDVKQKAFGNEHYEFLGSDLPTLYLQFDTSFSGDDNYKQYYEIYKANSDIDFGKYFYSAIVFLAGLIILLILSCTLAGHKNGAKVTAKIDKVPNDIHFIVSVGLIFLMGFCGFYALYECISAVTVVGRNVPPIITKWIYIGINAALCGLYLFLLEWLTSVCRQVKAKSGYFKNTLIYKFLRIFKCFKKLAHKTKDALSYKPENFMARIITIIVAYCGVSVFLLCLFGLLLGAEGYFLAFLTAVLLVAVTAGGWFFAIRYVINLDKIITSAHNRTTPDVNYNKLPNSLKTLVDSLSVNKEELNRAVDKAVRDEHMRTELITNVSHDLKTPLTSIINYVDLLEKCNIDDETAREYIAVLDEKGGKLKRLIDDLIEASKATSGVITVNAVQLNLNELVTQAIVEHQQEFANNNLELIFKGDVKNITAYADGNKAYRVIENLLSNARKYSAKGSRVYADVYNESGKAVFEIKNISAEPLDITPQELTQRFVRGDKSRNMDGNGLGLSIAESFCLAMNGRLELSIDGDLFKAKVILPS